ncbi:MAG: PEP-CTERM sorting domain-containing protein [Deltaproteobacteria bacterium]|nr:PEP-CTERM sorting domain-containing protein [Deltaproteobacteria bacterium]
MRKFMMLLWLISLFFATGLYAGAVEAYTVDGTISETAYNWQRPDLTWTDSADDNSSGKIALPFPVTLGGKTFDAFDMDSNGYVELLSWTETPTGYGYGNVDDLIADNSSATYLLAAYDDLSSYDYGAYGYDDSLSDRVIFDYLTETYEDEGCFYLNNFEMILYQNGTIDWNFRFADYDSYDNDLFTGLYLGNTGTLLEGTDNEIPELTSYRYSPVPEPSSLLLLSGGLAGLFAVVRKRGR